MIRKKLQIIRKDDLLYLTPSLDQKINSKCNINKFTHTVQKKWKLNSSNIIDLREDLVKHRVQGVVHIYIKFIDKSLNKLLNGDETLKVFPEITEENQFDSNPYLIDNVWVASLNRLKSKNERNKFIYKYDDEKGDAQVISSQPILDNLIYFDNSVGSYTSNYMYGSDYESNWIYSQAAFYMDYKKIAFEKNYLLMNRISEGGYGFFEISVRTPYSKSYTPDEAEVIFCYDDNINNSMIQTANGIADGIAEAEVIATPVNSNLECNAFVIN